MCSRSSSYGTSLEWTESMSPPGQVWMPMLRRSSGEKRSITRLLRSMNSWSMSLLVQGLRESFLVREPALGEVDRDPLGAGGGRLADVLLDLVAEVAEELLA